jgi:uncharacterized protein (TIGR03000 family)
MSGPRFSIPMIATLAAAVLWLSAAPALAAGSRGGSGSRGGGSRGGGGGRGGAVVVGGSRGGSYRGGAVVVGGSRGGSYRGGAVVVGGSRGGYSGGYRSGYYSGYRGGYSGGYYGGYRGLYAPGYFGGVGIYVGSPGYDEPTYVPSYAYPSQPAVISSGSPDTGVAGPPPGQPDEPPPPPDGTAAVTVIVPPAAEVFFNGDATQQKGEQREFVTPTLPVGRAYQYEVHARWNANGKVVDQTRTVIVHSNERTLVDFSRAEPLAPPIPAPPVPK